MVLNICKRTHGIFKFEKLIFAYMDIIWLDMHVIQHYQLYSPRLKLVGWQGFQQVQVLLLFLLPTILTKDVTKCSGNSGKPQTLSTCKIIKIIREEEFCPHTMLDKMKFEQWKERQDIWLTTSVARIGLVPGPAPREWIKIQQGLQWPTNLGFTLTQCFEALFMDCNTSDAHPNLLLHLNASLTLKSLWCVRKGELGWRSGLCSHCSLSRLYSRCLHRFGDLLSRRCGWQLFL